MEEMGNIDFNLYKVFLAVAKTGSISKAAELLYVSQPAVSYSIKTLEKELGCKLFCRTSKGTELTADAYKLLFYVENAYNTIYTGYRMLNDTTDLLTGQIRIGMPTHIGTFLISKYIQRFSEHHPGIKFHIVNKSTNEMVDLLEKRMIDIIVDSYPIFSKREDFNIYELMEVENCFVGNAKYKELSKKRKIEIEDMQKYPLLLPPSNTSTRKCLEEIVKDSIHGLDALVEVPTTEVMLDLVKRGMGIGYFAKNSVLDELNSKDLFEIPVNIQLPRTKICIAYVNEFLTNAPREFINILKSDNVINKKKKSLRIVLTQDCVYNCKFCHKEGIYDKKEETLDAEDISYIYEISNKNLGISNVHLTGGEPLIRKDILSILEGLKKVGAKVIVTTNGYLIDKNIDMGNWLDKINISLHTLSKSSYNNISGKNDSYEKTINNIKVLRAKYPTLNICINTTLVKSLNSASQNMEDLIKFASSVKANLKIVEMFPKNSEEFLDINSVVPKLEKIGFKLIKNTFRKKIYTNGKQEIILARCTCSIVSEVEDKCNVCKSNNDIYISPNGKIRICRMSNEEIDLLNNVKSRNSEMLISQLEKACDIMGDNCKC